ncbi:MAG: hypothetical protein KVP17_002162 [Porospora cf. gigantea B]|nr:MAG: hypothetical protein KVP17_002162 [Porospora cf. gigantea B]
MEEAAVLEEEIRSLSNQLGRIKAKHADMFELEERAVAAQKQADGYLTQLLAAQSRLSRITVYKDTDSKARTIESLQRNLQILQASHDKLTAQNRHLKVALDQAEQRQARPRSAAPNDGDIRVSISLREKEELLRLRKQPEDGDLRSRLHAALAANDALEKRVEAQSHQLSRYSDSSPGSAGLRRRENQLLTESRADESSSRRREHRTMVATIHELAFRVHLLQIEHTAALGGRAQVEAASMDE